MTQQNNENNQPKMLLLEAPKAPPKEAPDARNSGQIAGRDPATGQFLPGNPGRPYGVRHFSTLFRDTVREIGGVTKDGQKVTYDKIIVKKMITMAVDGNIKAASMVIDRVDGKVPQTVEINKTERVGVVVYTPKEIEDYELMFSRNDKPKANSITQASDNGGTPSLEGATQGGAYE